MLQTRGQCDTTLSPSDDQDVGLVLVPEAFLPLSSFVRPVELFSVRSVLDTFGPVTALGLGACDEFPGRGQQRPDLSVT